MGDNTLMPPMPTWIKETDLAFYLMEGGYYLEKIEKQPRPPGVGEAGEKVLALELMRAWFARPEADIPRAMVVAVGIGARDPEPLPQITLTDLPTAVSVGEVFTIAGQVVQGLAGAAVDLYVEVNGTFYRQTQDSNNQPLVDEAGSFRIRFGFTSPGVRRLKVTVASLSQVFEIDVRAAFAITQMPGSVLAGESFTIAGTAPLQAAGEPVRLFVDDRAQPSQATVNADGSWQLSFGMFSLGKRRLKVAVGDAAEERPVQVVLKPLFKNFKVPEIQLSSPNYPVTTSEVLGPISLTGGFMEPSGHSWKPAAYAIFASRPTEIQILPPSQRNYGIDYVVSTAGQPIYNWYPGRVTQVGNEGSYGLRCRMDFSIFFEFKGRRYLVKGAYAHGKSFAVKVGQYVRQGEAIGVMGNSGGNYPLHVDFRLWIEAEGKLVDLSPNLLEAQLRQQEAR